MRFAEPSTTSCATSGLEELSRLLDCVWCWQFFVLHSKKKACGRSVLGRLLCIGGLPWGGRLSWGGRLPWGGLSTCRLLLHCGRLLGSWTATWCCPLFLDQHQRVVDKSRGRVKHVEHRRGAVPLPRWQRWWALLGRWTGGLVERLLLIHLVLVLACRTVRPVRPWAGLGKDGEHLDGLRAFHLLAQTTGSWSLSRRTCYLGWAIVPVQDI